MELKFLLKVVPSKSVTTPSTNAPVLPIVPGLAAADESALAVSNPARK